MKWLRLYDDVLDDPKVQRLPPTLFKAWINLLCLASKGDVRGVLPSLEDIAFRLRMSEEEATSILSDLKKRGLIDPTSEGDMPHEWESRQPESDDVSRRVAEHRARKKTSANPALPVTLHETLPIQKCNVIDVDKRREDTEEKQKQMQGVREPQDETEQKVPTASATAPFLEVIGGSAPLNAATPAITSKAPPLPSPLRNPQTPPGWYTDLTANGYTPQEISAAMRVYEERGKAYDKPRETLVRYFTPLLNDLRERNANSQGLPSLASPAKAREPTPEEVAAREAEDARARELGRQAAERAKQRRASGQQPEIGAN